MDYKELVKTIEGDIDNIKTGVGVEEVGIDPSSLKQKLKELVKLLDKEITAAQERVDSSKKKRKDRAEPPSQEVKMEDAGPKATERPAAPFEIGDRVEWKFNEYNGKHKGTVEKIDYENKMASVNPDIPVMPMKALPFSELEKVENEKDEFVY